MAETGDFARLSSTFRWVHFAHLPTLGTHRMLSTASAARGRSMRNWSRDDWIFVGAVTATAVGGVAFGAMGMESVCRWLADVLPFR